VGGWSTTRIGRFYNGRHHSTVLRAIAKVERLRQIDESIDALIEVVTAAVSPAVNGHEISFQTKERAVLIEAIAVRQRVRCELRNAEALHSQCDG
jgi:hypothetical protein